MKKVILSSLLILGLVFSLPVLSQAGGHASGSSCEKKCSKSSSDYKSKCKVDKLKKKFMFVWENKEALNLSQDQLNKLKELKRSATKDLIRQSADAKVVKVDLKSEMWEPTIDLNKVNVLVEQKYDAKKKVALTYVKAIADMRNILTEQQRHMLIEMKTAKYLGKDYSKSCDKSYDKKDCCGKCEGKSSPKMCPITGKVLEMKGSHGHEH